MIRYLHYSRTIEKQLKVFRRSGQSGSLAAEQYQMLVNLIRQGELLSESVYTKRTKHGEYRLSNCVKYDLGNGYRMVTIRVGQDLFIPFIGSHDETDKWLDRRKHDEYSSNDPSYIRDEVILADESVLHISKKIGEQHNENFIEPDVYEQQLAERLDDSVLREVFGSLYRK